MLIDHVPVKKSKPKKSGYGTLYRKKAQTISVSIDVRGKSLDDAVMDVEKYIDDAFISGLRRSDDHSWSRRRDPTKGYSGSAEAQ